MTRLAVVLVVVLGCNSSTAELEAKVEQLSKELEASRTANRDLDLRIDKLAEELAGVRYLERKLDEIMREQRKTSDLIATRPSLPSHRPVRPEPDRSKTYAAPVAGAPFEGPADAKVTIVKAYEYACPYCEKARQTMADLRRKYGRDLRIVYQQYVVHPHTATTSSLAACAAGKQQKFAKLDPILWEDGFKARRFDPDRCWESTGDGCPIVMQHARKAGLDIQRLRADMVGCVDEIARTKTQLEAIGVRATPNFYINGRYLAGAQPVDNFAAIIDEELAKATTRIAQGTPQASYYDEWVLKQGLTRLDPVPAPSLGGP